MSKTLDDLIKRRQLQKAEGQFLKEGRKRGPGSYTASQTGASALAAARAGQKPSLRDMATRSGMSATPKGMTNQFQEPSAGDVEDMISGKKKKGGY